MTSAHDRHAQAVAAVQAEVTGLGNLILAARDEAGQVQGLVQSVVGDNPATMMVLRWQVEKIKQDLDELVPLPVLINTELARYRKGFS